MKKEWFHVIQNNYDFKVILHFLWREQEVFNVCCLIETLALLVKEFKWI